MKHFLCGLALLLLFSKAPAQTQDGSTNAPIKITPAEAKDHFGTNAIVTGTIAEVKITDRIAYLNFEKPFPNMAFTGIVYGPKTNVFQELEKLQGKTVEVSGKISDRNGKPQMILSRTNQLKLVESPAGNDKK
jgi:hypothetical protein